MKNNKNNKNNSPRSDFDPGIFPFYSEDHLLDLLGRVTPIEELEGFQIKRDDRLSLGGIKGGKVRQCLTLVRKEIDYIIARCNRGIMTAANLPSPQVAIVASVARYFGLHCSVVVPKYKDSARDYNRINVSIAQHQGADIYGARGGRPTIVEKDGRDLQRKLGYYMIKFGIAGDTETVIRATAPQVVNIPNSVKTVVMVGGSGLSGLGVLLGLKEFGKSHVEKIHFVTFAQHIHKNFKIWIPLLKLDQAPTKWEFHKSPLSYQEFHNPLDFQLDLTYESKAWRWMIDSGFTPSPDLLFWDIGIREYDLDLITKIKWHKLPEKNLKGFELF